jgi:hypothetical protein
LAGLVLSKIWEEFGRLKNRGIKIIFLFKIILFILLKRLNYLLKRLNIKLSRQLPAE